MANNISSIQQLAVTAKQTAPSLTKIAGIIPNGTQPIPAAGPSIPGLKNVSMAALYTATAGGSDFNTSALNSLRTNLSAGLNAPNVAGALGGVIGSDAYAAGASSALSAVSGSSISSLSKFSDSGMASLANASFSVGSSDLDLPGLSGAGALGDYTVADAEQPPADDVPKDWIFITTPGDISWDKQGETSIVNTYGTNSPYVIYSSTSMRKLSLGDCLIEGFSAGKEVEDHVVKLEKLMTMVMNTQKGYVSPYVWDLRANDKSYGHFIIESVGIKEDMRNEKGRADRATATISLQQVPDFQINDGRDLATKADLASGKSVVEEKDKDPAAAAADAGGTKKTSADPSKATSAASKAAAGGSSAAGGAASAAKDASPPPITGRASGGGQFTGPGQ